MIIDGEETIPIRMTSPYMGKPVVSYITLTELRHFMARSHRLRVEEEKEAQKEREQYQQKQRAAFEGSAWSFFDPWFFDDFLRGYDSGRGSQSNQHGEAPKQSSRSPIERLHQLAELAYPSAMEPRKIYRRAMRHCHPDRGGTREKWDELEYLGRRLGIKV